MRWWTKRVSECRSMQELGLTLQVHEKHFLDRILPSGRPARRTCNVITANGATITGYNACTRSSSPNPDRTWPTSNVQRNIWGQQQQQQHQQHAGSPCHEIQVGFLSAKRSLCRFLPSRFCGLGYIAASTGPRISATLEIAPTLRSVFAHRGQTELCPNWSTF